MVPPALAARHDRSLAVLGMPLNTQTVTYADISTLWAVAYLDDRLPDHAARSPIGDRAGMDADIAAAAAFAARRYGTRSRGLLKASLEIMDWMDRLLRDLGLPPDRKRAVIRADPAARKKDWLG